MPDVGVQLTPWTLKGLHEKRFTSCSNNMANTALQPSLHTGSPHLSGWQLHPSGHCGQDLEVTRDSTSGSLPQKPENVYL